MTFRPRSGTNTLTTTTAGLKIEPNDRFKFSKVFHFVCSCSFLREGKSDCRAVCVYSAAFMNLPGHPLLG